MTTDPARRSTHAEPTEHSGGRLRVLVVEDNAGDRWFLSELLRARGYEVVSSASAEEAWEILRESLPQLILLDLMLPGIDGGELCKRIREHPMGWEPVILVVTGRDESKVLSEILEAGADDFLRKPIDPALLDIRLAIAERRVRDRAERRGTRAALESTTWELEQLFRNLPDVFFSADVTEDRLIQISPSAKTLLGHGPETLLEDRALWKTILLPPGREEGDEDGNWAGFSKVEPGDRVVLEYPLERPDGSTVSVRTSLSFVLDPGTDHVRADGFLVDTTEEHRARTELARRNEELAALYRVSELTLTSDSVAETYDRILEEVARVMETPIALLEELDRGQDRLVTLAAHGLALPEEGSLEVPLHQTPSGIAVQTGKPFIAEDLRTHQDVKSEAALGVEPRAWVSFPLSAGGAVTGTLTLVDTVTRTTDERWIRLGGSLASTIAAFMERLEAEEALRDSEARYRNLVSELQQANQELESFAYSVSHDLRAPLRTMQGFAHALLQNYGEGLDPEARDYARRIIASGRQSERLITDLLSYSRLSFEKLDVKPVELSSVVEQAIELVQADVDESSARIDIQPKLPTVLGSHTALVQVMANLVSNAVKFVPEDRRPEVAIRTEENGDLIRVWVEDNGIGVPDGQEERIFRVFERLGEGGKHPGTGIGLAIVRRGMQRIGGNCGVVKRPEGGSAFWVEVIKERRRHRRPWIRRGRG